MDVALAAAPPLRRFYLTSERAILGFASVAAVLLAWEWVAARGLVPLVFISSPTRIAKAAIELAESGGLWNDLRVSGIEFFVGYALSVAVGIPLGSPPAGTGASSTCWTPTSPPCTPRPASPCSP